MFAGIELGGTKIIVAAGTGPEDLTAPARIPTSSIAELTMAAVVNELKRLESHHGQFEAIGIASFGPLGLTPGTATYGKMLRTSKPGWTHAELLKPIQVAFPDTPIGLDTDVNGAALGEMTWGNAQGLDTFAYITVGTGIGVGIFNAGKPVHGLQHPEVGHIRLQHDWTRDPYKGRCPFHGDCAEGLASGPTLLDRTGIAGEDLPVDHPAWNLIGEYLAQMYHNLIMVASPQRILVGGGVGLHLRVLQASREYLHPSLAGYIEALSDRETLDTYVVRAGLGERAGILGALMLAKQAL